MEESELLRLLHRGDPAGLEALIVRYTPYVSAVAARILPGCPREWEEVAADVFWAAWQERKKLRPGRLKGWLSVTARNRALNLLRSRRETVPLAEDVLILSGDGPSRNWRAGRRPVWYGRRCPLWSGRTGNCLSADITTDRRWPGRRRRWG